MKIYGVHEGEIFNPALTLPDLNLIGHTWIVVEAISEKDALHQANLWDRKDHPMQHLLRRAFDVLKKTLDQNEARDFIFENQYPAFIKTGTVVVEVEARDFTVFHGVERLFKKRYWAAEITGKDEKYKFKRDFLMGNIDFSRSNKKASRGVFIYYTLSPGKIYEISHPVSNKHTDRYFCRVINNVIVRMTEEEVTDWLSADLE